MRSTTSRLLMILLCAAPLALAACQNHEHPGDEAASSSNSEEHPGDSESGHDDSAASSDSEHPGDE